MPRHARIVIPGLPHHITQRGNNRQDVFFVDADRVKYLELLREQCEKPHFIYTQYINRLHGRSGHLWQGRFLSCPMDTGHAVRGMCYVERNPVRAKMTRVPWTYRWSSAAAHTGGADSSGLLDLSAWANLVDDAPWKKLLTERDDPESVAAMRLNTHTGRPLATDSFLSKLEHKLNRRLRPLPVGRPRKPHAPGKGRPNKAPQ